MAYLIIRPHNLGIGLVEKAGTSSIYDVIRRAKAVNGTFGRLYVEKQEFVATWSFAVVRHPIDRMLSAYADRVAPGHLLKGMTWGEFVNYVSVTPDDQLNVHFTSQTYKLMDGDNCLVDRVFKLEQINQQWAVIQDEAERKTGFELPAIQHINLSKDKPQITDQQRAALRLRYVQDFRYFDYGN